VPVEIAREVTVEQRGSEEGNLTKKIITERQSKVTKEMIA